MSEELKIRCYPGVSWIDPAAVHGLSPSLLPQSAFQTHVFCANCPLESLYNAITQLTIIGIYSLGFQV